MVGAEAEHIRDHIWPVMGLSKETNMSGLTVEPSGGLKMNAANLALMLVKSLDVEPHSRVADYTLDGGTTSGRGSRTLWDS